jgi:CRISPR-associated endonuclease Csy4
MKYYLDITLLPDAEANIGFIWQKLYGQLHLALVEQQTENGNSTIAVSFPEYRNSTFPLGSKLRLLASTEEQLRQLNLAKWLNRLSDYTHCTSIKEVPASVTQHARFRRVQFDTNVERLARRRVKRKGGTLEDALAHYAGFSDQQSRLPFLNIQSLSKGGRFCLFIDQNISGQAEEGEFNCYGLSKTATVPWF